MAKVWKLTLGVFAVILLNYYCFYVRGHGERIVNDITARANQALVNAGIIGVTVAAEVRPTRRRFHLAGPLPADKQAEAVRIVEQVPGVAEAVWDNEASAAQ